MAVPPPPRLLILTVPPGAMVLVVVWPSFVIWIVPPLGNVITGQPDTTIKLPEGGAVNGDGQGGLVVPEGTEVKKDGENTPTVVVGGNGGSVGKDGNVNLPEGVWSWYGRPS